MKPLLLVIFSFLLLSASGQQTTLTSTNWKPNKDVSALIINDTLILTKRNKDAVGLIAFTVTGKLRKIHGISYQKRTPDGFVKCVEYTWDPFGYYSQTATELTITVYGTTWALKPLPNTPDSLLKFVVTGMGQL